MRRPRPAAARHAPRRGTALLLVVVLVGAALALAVSFLHLGVSEQRIREHADARAAVRRAARAGLLRALAEMRAPGWSPAWEANGEGRDVWARGPGGTVGDLGGAIRVESNFVPVDPRTGNPRDLLEAALSLRVTATARRADAGGAVVTATVAARVRLNPRVGAIGDGGDDRALSPSDWTAGARADWAAASARAVVADGDRGGVSVALAPQVRLAGDVWGRGQVRWPNAGDTLHFRYSTRNDILKSVGRLAPGAAGSARGTVAAWPAPIAGTVQIRNGEWGDTAVQFDALNVRRPAAGEAAGRIERPAVTDYVRYGDGYRVYAGGPRYRPVVLSDGDVTADGANHGPTDANPLGLFLADGQATLTGGTRVAGTLAAWSVRVTGRADVTSPTFADADGTPWFPGSDRWPRPPAVVSGKDLSVTDTARCEVVGGALCGGDLTVAAGSATGGAPVWGVVAEVREEDAAGRLKLKLDVTAGSLGRVAANGSRALHLFAAGDEPPAAGYAIEKVRSDVSVVKAAGAADDPAAVAGARFVIPAPDGGRARFFGPTVARTVFVHPPGSWAGLTADEWEAAREEWEDTDDDHPDRRDEWVRLLADPDTWDEVWDEVHDRNRADEPYRTAGLPVAPTVTFAAAPTPPGFAEPPPAAFGPPLFRPDPALAADPDGGLRWDVLTWEESE